MSHARRAVLLILLTATASAAQVRQFANPVGTDDIAYAFTAGPDGMIYLATISSNLAKFFRLDPAEPERGVINLGAPSTTETFVNSGAILVGADGRIYAGTYPGAKLISYDPATGALADHGRTDDTQKYNKHLAQGAGDWIYCGLGVDRPGIAAWNPATGERRAIAAGPDGVAGTGYTHTGADGHAYGSVGEQHFRLLDIASRQVIHHAPIGLGAQQRNSLSQHPGGLIYGLTESAIYTVDPTTFEVTTLASLPVPARCGWATNESDIYFGSTDHVWRYRLETGAFEDLGVAVTTANLYGSLVGPDESGALNTLYFLFKTGHGLVLAQVKPDPPSTEPVANLLANADFEAGDVVGEVPSSWHAQPGYGDCELSDTVNHTPGGEHAVKVTVRNANGGNSLQPLPAPESFPYGADLYVSGWVCVPEGENVERVRLYANLEGGYAFIDAELPVDASFARDEWVHIGPTVVRVDPGGYYPGATLLLTAFGEEGACAYFDDIAIQVVEPTPAVP